MPMKLHQRTIGRNDEWLTPPGIIDAIGPFDLDPCAPVNRPWPTAARHYTINDDGLSQKWRGRVWCNPPFNRYERPKWMARMAQHNNGILLVPAAAETAAFHQHVWGTAAGLLMLKKRPHFYTVTGNRATANSGCTICLVAYGHENLTALINSRLGVVLIEPNQ